MTTRTENFRIPHGVWAIIPHTGLAILQASGTSIVATATADDVVVDTGSAIRIRHSDVTGAWQQNSVYAESLGHPSDGGRR